MGGADLPRPPLRAGAFLWVARVPSLSVATPADPCTMATDIAMRGSGELLHQIKSKNLSPADASTYASLLIAADDKGQVQLGNGIFYSSSVQRLIALNFCARVSPSVLVLNPHVAQLGDTPTKRGQLRKAFRQLVGA